MTLAPVLITSFSLQGNIYLVLAPELKETTVYITLLIYKGMSAEVYFGRNY